MEIGIGAVIPVPVSTVDLVSPAGLTATPNVGGGTFAAGTYYWVVTGTDALGETTGSNEANAVIALNGTATLNWTYLPPGTTGVKVYRGTAPGAENALIATLGNVLTYLDTGTVGSAATPPTVNTAEVGTQVVFNGECTFHGYALRETSGANPVSLSVRNGGQEIFPVQIASSQVGAQWLGVPGIHVRNELIIKANSGTFAGSVFVRYL